jgi:hypothetical protein
MAQPVPYAPAALAGITSPVVVMPGARRPAAAADAGAHAACTPGAADLNAAVYGTALHSLVEVLENAFGAGASRVSLDLRPWGPDGQHALIFVDDGHGLATGDLAGVFNAGYSTGEMSSGVRALSLSAWRRR